MKRPYADYVEYAMRQYIDRQYAWETRAEQRNAEACIIALDSMPQEEREIIARLYELRDTMADNVYRVSKFQGYKQDEVWDILHKFEDIFARQRGLL